MIVRNLTLKVQGNRTCTDSPIYLYQNDRNIHLVITLNNVKYEVTRDMYVSFTIVKPNGDTLDLTNGFLKDGKVHLILESELFDGDEEVGNALCQIKLYDNQRLSSISLPPFAIHVLKDNGNPIIDNDKDVLLSQDELKLLSENELALSVERKIKISELPTTTEASGYVPVVQNDKTMRYNLDGLATKQFVRENLNETLNEVTEQMDVVNQMAVSLEGKADISDLEEYATKQELENALSNLDVDVDLSAYALKSEVPSIEGLATTQYVDEAISNIDTGGGSSDIDLSGYVTTTQLTTELNKKANTNHKHDDRYSSTYLNNNPINSMDDVQNIYLSEYYRHYDVREEGFFENIRIVLPTNLTTEYVYEYHIYFNPTEFSNSPYKKNIFVTGGTVKWQQGTSLEIDSQHIYEIILTYVGGVYSSSRYWLGGVVVYG